MKLRGDARSRASSSTGATPFSDVEDPRKPPARPAATGAPGSARGGGADSARQSSSAAAITITPAHSLIVGSGTALSTSTPSQSPGTLPAIRPATLRR